MNIYNVFVVAVFALCLRGVNSQISFSCTTFDPSIAIATGPACAPFVSDQISLIIN